MGDSMNKSTTNKGSCGSIMIIRRAVLAMHHGGKPSDDDVAHSSTIERVDYA